MKFKQQLKSSIVLLILSASLISGCAYKNNYASVPIRVGSITGDLPIRSWKELRDDKIIKQKHDYSCGAASLATILKFYYNLDVTEQDVLKVANKEVWLSFADLYGTLESFDMKGYALALSFEQLRNLKVPVILYIEHKRSPHFAVLRGIDDRVVWVADPAHGNTKYPIKRFQDKWEVREDEEFKGKVLLVLPKDRTKLAVTDDFFKVPRSKSKAQELK